MEDPICRGLSSPKASPQRLLTAPASGPMTCEILFYFPASAHAVPSAWSPSPNRHVSGSSFFQSYLNATSSERPSLITLLEIGSVPIHFLHSTYCCVLFCFFIVFVSLLGYSFGSLFPRSMLLQLVVVKDQCLFVFLFSICHRSILYKLH